MATLFRRRPRTRHDTGTSPLAVGLIAIAVVVVFSYFAYTQANPFSSPYKFSAVFETASNLKADSPVRIAGVNVGKVTKVEPIGDRGAARVEMEVEDRALPIHRDATVKIRPRIFLEGNFFVDLEPGSPSSPELEDGGTLPVNQTATPVQFADVLAALQSDTRHDLQTFLDEYSRGLAGKGARGLNEVYRYGEDAYRLSAQANEATLGEEEHDLSRLVRGQNLRDLVTNFNTFAAALAREDDALAATIPALDDVLRVGSPALRSLNDSLPSLRAFARDALPAARTSGPTIDANLPFIKQARRLFAERELRGLVRDLEPTVPQLVRLDQGQTKFMDQSRALSACQSNVLVPFATTPIPEPEFPDNSGQPFYKQAPRGLVGLAGESRIYDTSSPMFHFNFGSGPYTLVQPGEDGSQLVGTALFPPLGVKPARPGHRPQFRPDVPCETQDPPNLNAPGGPPTAKAMKISAKPRTQKDRELLTKADAAYKRLEQHFRDLMAGRPTLDPLSYTQRGLRLEAKRRGLRMLSDGRFVPLKRREGKQ
jgi:phospholipid/cholesterol/gamma-HCH transport system substrate-binding protein